ncbi:hypothetical protein E1A91_A13G062900v1 [Gossypium mustelinum]|uniref:Uncharacterized protein n=1 Tax=Gossypium mustelinum TaxID=34275 RepID=A0A5D2WEX7_GOSMU|nr:hypothetical protein E1A91_A13G062900v1 [Gossypium mustelinum]
MHGFHERILLHCHFSTPANGTHEKAQVIEYTVDYSKAIQFFLFILFSFFNYKKGLNVLCRKRDYSHCTHTRTLYTYRIQRKFRKRIFKVILRSGRGSNGIKCF